MEDRSILKNSQIIILGLCIAAATVAASTIISKSVVQVMKMQKEVIGVKGSAEKQIKSDHIVWYLRFSRRALDRKTALTQLDADSKLVKEYLLSKGIPESEIEFYSVGTEILYKKNEKGNDTNTVEAYELSISAEVKSAEVMKVTDIEKKSDALIHQGVELVSHSPKYFYTKLPELKLEMLEEATRNAKARAEKMASATGSKIGFMRGAKMGVFQITPVTSVDVSDWGENDTSSYEKKVMAVVSAEFSILA